MTADTRWDVVVVGSANTDYMGRASKLPVPGATVRGDTFLTGAGGKGANQAVAAARLDARVALVGKVGEDERGRGLVDHLRRADVNTHCVRSEAHQPTGAAVIQIDQQGEKQILMVPGANGHLSAEDVRRAESNIRNTRVMVTQLEIPMEAVQTAISLGHGCGACTILDPAPPSPLEDDLLRMVSIIRPNADEAEALTGVHVHDRTSAHKAAEMLLQRGVGAVAVGVGAQGNLLIWPGGECWYSGHHVDSVDATGAGDAFVGALAARIARGESLQEAGRFANAAAALATTRLGAEAGLPTTQEVLRLLSDHYQNQG